MTIQSKVTVKVEEGNEYTLKRPAIAWIDPKACINCGTCREYCPVDAISERQREICRICPSCTPKPGLTFDEMRALTDSKSCTTACPLGISPQGYINLMRVGKMDAAYKLIWEKAPLPGVLGRICHHPCESDCKRGILIDEPIAIRGLKRHLTEALPQWKPEKYPVMHEERIAIIGSGPAGLTAAHYLSLSGYSVTIFDEASEPGGMLLRGIPSFRLPREVVRKEIQALEEAGIEMKMETRIGSKQINTLFEEFDIVLVASGAPNSKSLKLPGWELEGIMTALDFMERINNGQDIYRHPGQEFQLDGEVVVIGGGSVAMDTARTALRYGAKKVTAICLECGEQIPAHKWELEEAEEEGVVLMPGWMPKRFVGNQPKLQGIEVCEVSDFKKDECGKIECCTKEGTEKMIPADWVIVSIGQTPDAMWKSFENDERVFFAGDIANQQVSVVNAMASGKKAAAKIDSKLRGGDLKDPLELRKLYKAPISEKIYPATRLKVKRYEMPMQDASERAHNFDEVELGFNDLEALTETNRCLQCGYQYVDPEKCLGCGVCQKVCPKGDVIQMVRISEEVK